MVHPPVITALATLPLLGLMMWLTLEVVKHRRKARASMGDGGSKELAQAIRMHANFAEYTPLALIGLGLAEMLGAWWPIIALGAISLVAGRFMHARSWAKGRAQFKWRVPAMYLTFGSYGIAGVGLVVALASSLFAS